MRNGLKVKNTAEYEDIQENYNLSKKYYDILTEIIQTHRNFKEIKGIKSFEGVEGVFVVSFNNSCKFYANYASDIGTSISNIWNKETSHDISLLFNQCKIFVAIDCDYSRVLSDIVEIIPEESILSSFMTEVKLINVRGEKNMTEKFRDKLDNLKNLDKRKCAVVGGVIAAIIGGLMVVRRILKGRG